MMKTCYSFAREMQISHRTVESHINKMIEILGCATSKELVSLYHD